MYTSKYIEYKRDDTEKPRCTNNLLKFIMLCVYHGDAATCRHKICTQNAIAISHFGAKALAEIKYIFRQKLRHTVVHPLYIFSGENIHDEVLVQKYNVCRYNSGTVGESIFIYTKLCIIRDNEEDESFSRSECQIYFFLVCALFPEGDIHFGDI